jgi:hypothetical protein
MMVTLITSVKHTLNKSNLGDIPKFPYVNNNKWKDNMAFILSAMRAYAIVNGDGSGPQPYDIHHDRK